MYDNLCRKNPESNSWNFVVTSKGLKTMSKTINFRSRAVRQQLILHSRLASLTGMHIPSGIAYQTHLAKQIAKDLKTLTPEELCKQRSQVLTMHEISMLKHGNALRRLTGLI
jgi:hypothetical protein